MKKNIIFQICLLYSLTIFHHAIGMQLARSWSGSGHTKHPQTITGQRYKEALSAKTPLDLLFVVQQAKHHGITEETLQRYVSEQEKQKIKDLFLFVAFQRIAEYNKNILSKKLDCITTLHQYAQECYDIYRVATDLRYGVNDAYGFKFTRSHQHKASQYPIFVPTHIAFKEFQVLEKNILNMQNDQALTTPQHWNMIIRMIQAQNKDNTSDKQSVISNEPYENLASESEKTL